MPTDATLANLITASFAADALALGAHWIYDQDELRTTFGRVTDFRRPLETSYHPRKAKGEQSHYGDQALVLMDSLAARKQFDFADFAERWAALWEGYPDYFDHATKETLANLQKGGSPDSAASESTELGGAARLAPLLVFLADEDIETVVRAARQQTRLTHGSGLAQDASEYLVRVVREVTAGADVPAAIRRSAEKQYQDLDMAEVLRRAEETLPLGPAAAIEELGQACPARQALPSVISLALRFPHDLETAAIENVMAGGDSAARGLVLGIILGAAGGKVPSRWQSELLSAERISEFLKARGSAV